MNKIYFGCRLIKTSKDSGILPEEQHRGRSDQTSIEFAVKDNYFYYT